MTREQAKQKLISFGNAEPTEEQITAFLNTIGVETKKEKERADGLKEDADKAAELQKELDRINEEKLSDIEKANANLEKANQRIAELEKAQAIRDQKDIVAEKFKVSREQAGKIVKEDGTLDYDFLGQIISEKETAAANAKEQEIANASSNPGGQEGNPDPDSKSNAVKLVERYIGNQNSGADILSHYTNGGK